MIVRFENTAELTELELFAAMTQDELDRISELCFIKSHPAGQTLFFEGMKGDLMYVVLEGEVEIYRHVGEGAEILARMGKGEFIGEGSLVLDGKRSTSCRISKDARLMVITRNAFQDLSETHATISTKLLRQFLKTSIIRLRTTHRVTE